MAAERCQIKIDVSAPVFIESVKKLFLKIKILTKTFLVKSVLKIVNQDFIERDASKTK